MVPSNPKIKFFIFIFSLLLFTAVAHAQLATPSNADDVVKLCARDPECNRHYVQAHTLSKANQLAEALKEYEAAYAIQAVPIFLYNIARLHHKLGHFDDAKNHYEHYLRVSPPSEAAQQHKTEDYLKQIENELENARRSSLLGPPAVPSEPPTQASGETKSGLPVPPKTSAQAEMSAQVDRSQPPHPVPSASQESPSQKPLYKKWWLWTLVGVVAAGTAAGIVGGVVASGNSGPPQSSLGNARVFSITISK